MVQLFDEGETAFTATAAHLAPNVGSSTVMDFSKWGNPERQKINEIIRIVNLHQWRRRGAL